MTLFPIYRSTPRFACKWQTDPLRWVHWDRVAVWFPEVCYSVWICHLHVFHRSIVRLVQLQRLAVSFAPQPFLIAHYSASRKIGTMWSSRECVCDVSSHIRLDQTCAFHKLLLEPKNDTTCLCYKGDLLNASWCYLQNRRIRLHLHILPTSIWREYIYNATAHCLLLFYLSNAIQLNGISLEIQKNQPKIHWK